MARASDKYNERLTEKEQLIHWFELGGSDKDNLSIGAEHEKFIFYKDDFSAVPYEGTKGRKGIKDLLEYIKDNYDWSPTYEKDKITGLKKDGANITLEPGGQLELSGAPLTNIHDVAEETENHLSQILEACHKMGMDSLGLGYHPIQTAEESPKMPVSRHESLGKYFKDKGCKETIDLMYSTCSTQVNLDYRNEEDMIKKLRVSLALQPIATAIFANSPFCEGKLTGEKSHRSHICENAAKGRYGFMMPVAFKDNFGFDKYAEFIAGISIIGAYHNNSFQFLEQDNIPFNECIKEKRIPIKEDHPLTMNDWFNHINTIWPEVRTRQWLEMRGADVASSAEMINALPAFWVGILYDDEALNKAYEMTKDWTDKDREHLRTEAAIHGLNAKFMGTTLQELAKNSVTLAELGLKNRDIKNSEGINEVSYIEPLKKIVTTGITQADELEQKFKSEWKQDVSKVFNLYSFGTRQKEKQQRLKKKNNNGLKKQ